MEEEIALKSGKALMQMIGLSEQRSKLSDDFWRTFDL